MKPFSCGNQIKSGSNTFHLFSFNDIETLALYHRKHIIDLKFDTIVSLARGGNYLASMLSQFCDVPLAYAHYNRADKSVTLMGEIGKRVLLVEDVAGSGLTLITTRTHLIDKGCNVHTFCVAHDDISKLVPDFSVKLTGAKYIFPWERTIAQRNSDVSAHRTEGEKETDRWVTAFDLDGIFLPDVPAQLYEANLDLALEQRASMLPFAQSPPLWERGYTVITARLESERAQTLNWLHTNGIEIGALHMRPNLNETSSEFKIRKCHELGVTEYVESEIEIAKAMANQMPATVVWHYDPQSLSINRVYLSTN